MTKIVNLKKAKHRLNLIGFTGKLKFNIIALEFQLNSIRIEVVTKDAFLPAMHTT